MAMLHACPVNLWLCALLFILFAHGYNRYGNKILVTDELPDGQMVDQWEPVSCDSVKTPLEVWPKLVYDGRVRLADQFSDTNASRLFSLP